MKNNKGFTLMEMVVATGIFAIVSVMIAQLFVSFSRAQQKSTAIQQLQSDARIMMSLVSDRIRFGTIDYLSYGGSISGAVDQLYLIDENAVPVIIRRSSENFADTVCLSELSTPCLEISEDNGATFSPMTSENIQVNTLAFNIDPTSDPTEPSGPDIQPRVTINIGISPAKVNTTAQDITYLQTSVSSRVYLK